MLQRLVAIVLGVLGLASIALGVASATAWRAQDTLVATTATTETSAGTLLITAPGVLELGGAPVTVTARASGGTKVVIAIGREADVAGWVGVDPHAVIAGLSDRSTLRIDAAEVEPIADPTPVPTEAPAEATVPADPAPAAVPDPDGSDLWVNQATGERSAELTWTPQPGRWTLLVAGAGEGATAPVVVLSWPQVVTTPWLVPGIALGAVLLVLALALGIRVWLRARRGEQANWHDVETRALPILVRADLTSATTGPGSPSPGGAVTGSAGSGPAGSTDQALADDAPTIVLTRRQMREAAATAPTPRVSLRRRAPRAPGDESRSETGSSPVAPSTPPTDSKPWVPGRPTDPEAPASPAAPPNGSRADAWRRSWGIPDGDAAGPSRSAATTAAPVLPTDPPDDHRPINPDSPRSGKDD